MGVKQAVLPDDAPSWAQIIYDELLRLRAERDAPSLAVGTGEAAEMLGIKPRTVREWHKVGKMPKPVSKEGQNLMWSRASIERLAEGRSAGGRNRSND